MLRVFIGYDQRQPISYNILQHSIISRSKSPVSITPLVYNQLSLTRRDGLTPFTYTRFLVPYLCEFKGWALFLDIDMLVLGNIQELFNLADDKYAVMVSKNKLRFEWASAMLFNCDKCTILTPSYVNNAKGLHTIDWLAPEQIGEFPNEWNHLVGYDQPRSEAKLVHYTQGIPAFPETNMCEYANEWHKEYGTVNSSQPWKMLMGNSVHAVDFNGEKIPRFRLDEYNRNAIKDHRETIANAVN